MKARNILIYGLTFAMLFGSVGCEEKKTYENENSLHETVGTQGNTQQSEASTDQTEEPEKWGLPCQTTTFRDDVFAWYWVSFPDFIGLSLGTGRITTQLDGSLIDVSCDTTGCPGVDDAASAFPALFPDLELTVSYHYGMKADDYVFEVTKQEAETINGKDMVRYNGDLHLTLDPYDKKEAAVFHWVAYAAQLEKNNAIAYWVVIDATENNSLGDKIYDTAYKMALTFEEEQP